ncbi:MAG: sulfatase, partial [Nannocystaceae bacterium]|nr:sulfatase [Nannocystaceae bacterium]
MWEDAAGFAGRTSDATGAPAGLLQVLVVVGASLSIPVTWAIAGRIARLRFGGVAVVGGVVAVYGLNANLWHQDNIGIHFFLSWVGAAALGSLIASGYVPVPGRWTAAFSRRPAWFARAGLGLLCIWAFVSTLHSPSNTVKIDINAWSPNLQALALRRGTSLPVTVEAPDLAPEQRGFFVDRASGPAIAPTKPPIIKADPIVILLTIDTLRYDLINNPKYAKYIPNILSLRDAGALFSQARTPGSQTAYTLSAFSTGKYFSQLYWSKYKTGLWLHDDPSEHLAELLNDGGVTTIFVPGAKWLSDEYGIIRGFAKGKYRKTKHKWTHGKNMTKRLNRALRKYAKRGPLFMYCHYFDPHVPYNRGTLKEGEPFERYLSEVQMVDELVGKIIAQIEDLGAWNRTLLMVSADHGEAFGEHGVKHRHSVNLYDEMIHVPLVARGPNVATREISQLVSIIDLGPTILDVFGVETPSAFMGQSLVPLLSGGDALLRRPIVAEGRLKRMMVFPNGIKVIEDQRADTVEVYDLKADPKELHNLSDSMDLATVNEYRMLREFFDVHTYKLNGYKPPGGPGSAWWSMGIRRRRNNCHHIVDARVWLAGPGHRLV